MMQIPSSLAFSHPPSKPYSGIPEQISKNKLKTTAEPEPVKPEKPLIRPIAYPYAEQDSPDEIKNRVDHPRYAQVILPTVCCGVPSGKRCGGRVREIGDYERVKKQPPARWKNGTSPKRLR